MTPDLVDVLVHLMAIFFEDSLVILYTFNFYGIDVIICIMI